MTERSKLNTNLAKINYLLTSVLAADCYGEGHEFEYPVEYSRPVQTFTNAFLCETEQKIFRPDENDSIDGS